LKLSIAAAFLIYDTGKTTITNQMQNDRASMTGNMRINNITTNNHQCDNSENIKSMDNATKTYTYTYTHTKHTMIRIDVVEGSNRAGNFVSRTTT